MSDNKNLRICPVELAGSLDNSVRRFLQNPQKILKLFIKKGMTVLDLGCGPGFFTVEIAKLLDASGKVIAADLQEGMLDEVRQKIHGTSLEQRIELVRCGENTIAVTEKVDFVLAFYMVHEVPDKDRLFKELLSILNPGGMVLIIEPKFHVSGKAFKKTKDIIQGAGFEISAGPKVFFSRSAILTKKNI